MRSIRDYQDDRKGSLFRLILGASISGERIRATNLGNYDVAIKSASTSLQNDADKLLKGYIAALEAKDISRMRSYYDPAMLSNDINGFSDTIAIKLQQQSVAKNVDNSGSLRNGYSLYAEDRTWGEMLPRNTRSYITATIEREVIKTDPTGKETRVKNLTTTTVSLTLAVRNGSFVITSSDLVLGYLPDAISKPNSRDVSDTDGLYREFGFQYYCAGPNLDVLFTETRSECYIPFARGEGPSLMSYR